MSYRRLRPQSLHANSEKNMVLRQQFAITLLETIKRKKYIINVDETWIGMSDFRRMRWCAKGQPNSLKQV